MKLKACGHHILVKVDTDLALKEYEKSLKPGEILKGNEIVTASGMFLRKSDFKPDAEMHGTNTGVVIQIGEEAYDNKPAPWCKVGDRVLFKRYPGIEIGGKMVGESESVMYLIMNDDDVFGVIQE